MISDEFRFHLVRWSKVCTPIYYPGLSIRNLLLFNEGLLGKCLWWYAIERELVMDSGAKWYLGRMVLKCGPWKFWRQGCGNNWEILGRFLLLLVFCEGWVEDQVLAQLMACGLAFEVNVPPWVVFVNLFTRTLFHCEKLQFFDNTPYGMLLL